jgi:hypothetical protein
MKEIVILTGIIIGGHPRVECTLRATKNTLDGDPSFPPLFTQHKVLESRLTALLADGEYEVIVNGELIRAVREYGQF